MKFKIGDRVRVYLSTTNIQTGTVQQIISNNEIKILCDVFLKPAYPNLFVHPKQCRKLVKKKKEININNVENLLKCMQLIREFEELVFLKKT